MYIPLSLLGSGSVKTLPRQRIHTQQRRIVGLVVLYAVRVVSKESRRLVLPRTSCLICVRMEEFGGTGDSKHNNHYHCSGYKIPQRYSDWLRAGRPRDRSSNPGRDTNFLFSTSSGPTLGPTLSPIQLVPGVLSPGVKRPGREDDH
jgi:hypothetical protein